MKTSKQWFLALLLSVLSISAFAAVPADVDTAIASTQADIVEIIGKGFAYLGAVGGAWMVLVFFYKILRRPGR